LHANARQDFPMNTQLFAILTLALAGCAPQTDREKSSMVAAGEPVTPGVKACLERSAGLPSYQALKDKLPPDDDLAPSMEMQTNTGKPTPEEIQLLLEYHQDGLTPCRKLALLDLGGINPILAAPLAEGYADADASYVRLIQGQITWGGYATAAYVRHLMVSRKLTFANAQIDRKQEISQTQEIQRRQVAAAAMGQWAHQQQVLNQQQQMINAKSRPVTTNCSYNGPLLNCTTN
jgi:hypothetical protein